MSRPFRSKLAPQFEEFILSRKAARRWSGSYEDNLHFFDNYCADSFPEQDVLIDEMLGWCRERPTENGNSCRYRITVVANFVRYANKKGWTDVMPPIVPSSCPCTYIPHAFSEKEIASLFEKVDADWNEIPQKEVFSKKHEETILDSNLPNIKIWLTIQNIDKEIKQESIKIYIMETSYHKYRIN